MKDQLTLDFWKPLLDLAPECKKSFAELVQERASQVLNAEDIKWLKALYEQAERELDNCEYYDPESDSYKRDLSRYDHFMSKASKEAEILARLLAVPVNRIISMTCD